MQDLLSEFTKNPTVFTLLIIILSGLIYFIYKVLNKQLNLDNQSYDDVINERAKELINNLSKRLDVLEIKDELYQKTIKQLEKDIKVKHDDNIRLAMLNAIILSSKTVIKGFPVWVFSYPENKAMYISEEYAVFLDNNITIADYIDQYNKDIWNSESANVYNENNKHAAENGFWIGYEPIITPSGKDFTNDYIVLKVGIRDNTGVIQKTFGIALNIKKNKIIEYLKVFVSKTEEIIEHETTHTHHT